MVNGGDGVGFGTDSQASRHILPCVGSWWDRELGQLLLCSVCGMRPLDFRLCMSGGFSPMSVHLKKKKNNSFSMEVFRKCVPYLPCLLQQCITKLFLQLWGRCH